MGRKVVSFLCFAVILAWNASPLRGQTTSSKPIQTQRAELAASLRDKANLSKEAHAAFALVPREQFLPALVQDLAYLDTEIPISGGGILPSPSSLARIISQAGVRAQDTVLLYGTGTGYTAAILGRLASQVSVVEKSPDLAAGYEKTLTGLGYGNVVVRAGTSIELFKEKGPFSLVIIQGAVRRIPPEALNQVRTGGRCVFALADASGFQILVSYEKGETGPAFRSIGESFLPFLDELK
jgi:protein-L-isoaspartate(D-aspartate) O-methyltransferase